MKYGLLVTVLLGVGIALGIGYGILHAGHRPSGPEAGMMETVEVTATRSDRVVDEVEVNAEGPKLVLPVVEVHASRHDGSGLAGRAVIDDIIAN